MLSLIKISGYKSYIDVEYKGENITAAAAAAAAEEEEEEEEEGIIKTRDILLAVANKI